jgi:four helix bundle protein
MAFIVDAAAQKKIRSFTDLHAWKEGHDLVKMIYQATKCFPKEETYGLTNQLRRAAVSVTSNIAEGFSRKSAREKRQFFSMALSSLTEIQNQILIAKDVGYMNQKEFDYLAKQTIRVGKLINGLKKTAMSIPNT